MMTKQLSLERLFSKSTTILALVDESGKLIQANTNLLQSLNGKNLSPIPGELFSQILPEYNLEWEVEKFHSKKDEFSFRGSSKRRGILFFRALLTHEDKGSKAWLIERDLEGEVSFLKGQNLNYTKLLNEMESMAKIGYWSIDLKTMNTKWSDQVYHIHEIPLGSPTNVKDGIEYYHPDYREMVNDKINSAIEKQESWEFEAKFITAKGNEKWVKAYGTPGVVDGNVVALEGLFLDNTELKTAKIKGEEIEHTFDLFFTNSEQLICLHEPDGEYIKVSPSAYSICGYKPEEMIGQNPYDHFHDDDKKRIQEESHRAILDQEKPNTEIEYRFQHKEGHFLWFETRTTPILDSNGEVKFLVTSSSNITRRKEAEENLEDLLANFQKELDDRTKELKSFNYTVSHDLKAPLRSISGFSQKLNEEFGDVLEEKGKRWLNFIMNNSNHMDSLINDILDYSQISNLALNSVRIKTSDLISLIGKELVEGYKDFPPIDFQYKDLDDMYMDRSMAYSLWLNLMDNAVKYSSNNDRIEIKIESEIEGDYQVFRICDNGIGIERRNWETIFEPFKRLHGRSEYEGTGIGLSSAKKIVERYAGGIKVVETSNGETGATIEFRIKKN